MNCKNSPQNQLKKKKMQIFSGTPPFFPTSPERRHFLTFTEEFGESNFQIFLTREKRYQIGFELQKNVKKCRFT